MAVVDCCYRTASEKRTAHPARCVRITNSQCADCATVENRRTTIVLPGYACPSALMLRLTSAKKSSSSDR